MSDTLLSSELAVVLAGDPVFLALIPHIHGEQSGEISARPSLVISGVFTPYGPRRLGMLDLEVKSRLADDPALALAGSGHAAQVDALQAKFFAAGAADALKALLVGRGKVELIEYGLAGPNPFDADETGDDLRTIIHLRVAWRIL